MIYSSDAAHPMYRNSDAYAYIALSSSQDFDEAKHLYDFSSNTNTGKIYYHEEEAEYTLYVTLNRKYHDDYVEPAYDVNNTTNIAQ